MTPREIIKQYDITTAMEDMRKEILIDTMKDDINDESTTKMENDMETLSEEIIPYDSITPFDKTNVYQDVSLYQPKKSKTNIKKKLNKKEKPILKEGNYSIKHKNRNFYLKGMMENKMLHSKDIQEWRLHHLKDNIYVIEHPNNMLLHPVTIINDFNSNRNEFKWKIFHKGGDDYMIQNVWNGEYLSCPCPKNKKDIIWKFNKV